MHEIDTVVFKAKHLGKLEDERFRREQLGVIAVALGFVYLGAVGIDGITGTNVFPVDSLVKLASPLIVGSGYGFFNLLRLFRVNTQINSIQSELMEMETESIDYEKPKRGMVTLGDDGELVDIVTNEIYIKDSQVNH